MKIKDAISLFQTYHIGLTMSLGKGTITAILVTRLYAFNPEDLYRF